MCAVQYTVFHHFEENKKKANFSSCFPENQQRLISYPPKNPIQCELLLFVIIDIAKVVRKSSIRLDFLNQSFQTNTNAVNYG